MKKKQVQALLAGMAITLSFSLPVTTVWAAVPEKDQTVYVNADEKGNADNIIVSNWLKNTSGDTSLTDNTALKDIQNVKGDETFTQNSDGTITWAADGNDIYYQGTTDAELPVSVKLTYYLDGKEISPAELAGKSGKVKIRIDYENHSRQTINVNGKQQMIHTPFLMVTGMILPTDTFSNVEVTNGKVISEGKNQIVMGVGLPGLADSLQISDIEGFEDTEIPDYVEISADADNFSLAMTATIATTGTLSELGLDDIDSLDDLKDSIDELTDASALLVDGSAELQEGVQTLDDSVATFADGLNSADDGAGQLKNGIDTMNSKKGDLLDGVDALVSGMKSLKSGASELESGVNDYTSGASQLNAGIEQVDQGVSQLKDGIDELNTKKEALSEGVEALAQGGKQLQNGADTLKQGIQNYTNGAAALQDGIQQLNSQLSVNLGQAADLPDALQTLASGTRQLIAGASTLQQGAQQAADKTTELQNTVNALAGGVNQSKNLVQDAIEAAKSLTVTVDTVAASTYATDKANAAVADENARVNAAAHAQLDNQKDAVRDTLKAANVNEETINAVLSQLNYSDIAPQTQPSITITDNTNNDNAIARLQSCKSGLENVATALSQQNMSQTVADVQALKDGANQAVSGARQLTTGLSALNEATAPLNNFSEMAESLLTAVDQLKTGVNALCGENNSNSNALNAGASSLDDGISSLNTGISALGEGTMALSDGVSQLASGAGQLKTGSQNLKTGANILIANNKQLNAGAAALAKGSADLLTGGLVLKSGADTLGTGIGQLADGAAALKEGTGKLADGGQDLKEGTGKLLDGATELADGMKEFDEEGIQELADVINIDLQDFLDRLQAVTDADKSYTAFDGAENGSGSVKFIIETAGIEIDD